MTNPFEDLKKKRLRDIESTASEMDAYQQKKKEQDEAWEQYGKAWVSWYKPIHQMIEEVLQQLQEAYYPECYVHGPGMPKSSELRYLVRPEGIALLPTWEMVYSWDEDIRFQGGRDPGEADYKTNFETRLQVALHFHKNRAPVIHCAAYGRQRECGCSRDQLIKALQDLLG